MRIISLLILEVFLVTSLGLSPLWAADSSLLRPRSFGQTFTRPVIASSVKDGGEKETGAPELVGITPKIQSVLLRNPRVDREIGSYEIILPPSAEVGEEVNSLKEILRRHLFTYAKGSVQFRDWLSQLEAQFGIPRGEADLTFEELKDFRGRFERLKGVPLRGSEKRKVEDLTTQLIDAGRKGETKNRLQEAKERKKREVTPDLKKVLSAYATGTTGIEGVYAVLEAAGVSNPEVFGHRVRLSEVRSDLTQFSNVLESLSDLVAGELVSKGGDETPKRSRAVGRDVIDVKTINEPLTRVLGRLRQNVSQKRDYDISQVKEELRGVLKGFGLWDAQVEALLKKIDLDQQVRLVGRLNITFAIKHQEEWLKEVVAEVVTVRRGERFTQRHPITLPEEALRKRVFGFLMMRIEGQIDDLDLAQRLTSVGIYDIEDILYTTDWTTFTPLDTHLAETTEAYFQRLFPHSEIIALQRIVSLTQSDDSPIQQLGQAFVELRQDALLWRELTTLLNDPEFQIAWVPYLPSGAEIVTEAEAGKTLRLNRHFKTYLVGNPEANLVPFLKLVLMNVFMVRAMKAYDQHRELTTTNDFIYDVVGFQSVIEAYATLSKEERRAIDHFNRWVHENALDIQTQLTRHLSFIETHAQDPLFDVEGIIEFLQGYFYYALNPFDSRIAMLIHERNQRFQNIDTIEKLRRGQEAASIPIVFGVSDLEGNIELLNKILTQIFSQFGFKGEIERAPHPFLEDGSVSEEGSVASQLAAQGLSFKTMPPFFIVFLGDVVGKEGEEGKKGTTQLETLARVRELVEAGVARMIVGANEYTLREVFLRDPTLTPFWFSIQKGREMLSEWQRIASQDASRYSGEERFRDSPFLKEQVDWINTHGKLEYDDPFHLLYFESPRLPLRKGRIDLSYGDAVGIEALEGMEGDIPVARLKDYLEVLLVDTVLQSAGWEEEIVAFGIDRFFDLLTLRGLGPKQVRTLVTRGPEKNYADANQFFRIDARIPTKPGEQGMGFFQVDQNGIHLWKIEVNDKRKISRFVKQTKVGRNDYLRNRREGQGERILEINEILKRTEKESPLGEIFPLTASRRGRLLRDFELLFEGPFNVDDEGNILNPPSTMQIDSFQRESKQVLAARRPEAVSANILINAVNGEGTLILGPKGSGVSLISKFLLESKNSDTLLGADNTAIVAYSQGTFVGGTRPLVHIPEARRPLITLGIKGTYEVARDLIPHERAVWITKVVFVLPESTSISSFIHSDREDLPPYFREGLLHILETRGLPVIRLDVPDPPTLKGYQAVAERLIGSQGEIGQRIWTLENEHQELISVRYKFALLKGYFDHLRTRPTRKDEPFLLEEISFVDRISIVDEVARENYLKGLRGGDSKLFHLEETDERGIFRPLINDTLVSQLDERRMRRFNRPLEEKPVPVDAEILQSNVERLLQKGPIDSRRFSQLIGKLAYEDAFRFVTERLSDEAIQRFQEAFHHEMPITNAFVVDPESGRIEVGGCFLSEDYETEKPYQVLLKRRGMKEGRPYVYGLLQRWIGKPAVVAFKTFGEGVKDEHYIHAAEHLILRGRMSPDEQLIVPGWGETTLGEFASLSGGEIVTHKGLKEEAADPNEPVGLKKTVQVRNHLGIHNRPTSILLKIGKMFSDTEIHLKNIDGDGTWIQPKEHYDILRLTAAFGNRIRVVTHGKRAAEAMVAIEEVLSIDDESQLDALVTRYGGSVFSKDGGLKKDLNLSPHQRLWMDGAI